MLSYETAVKLKEAGFRQFRFDTLNPYKGEIYFPTGRCLPYGHPDTNILIKMGVENGEDPKKELVYSPTLSELIEACGDRFAELSKGNSQVDAPWTASGLPIKIGFCGQGDTAEEAVAALYLLINSK